LSQDDIWTDPGHGTPALSPIAQDNRNHNEKSPQTQQTTTVSTKTAEKTNDMLLANPPSGSHGTILTQTERERLDIFYFSVRILTPRGTTWEKNKCGIHTMGKLTFKFINEGKEKNLPS